MPEVLSEIADGVAVLALDAPDRRNALTLGMVDEITAAVDAAEADPGVGALVVTGTAPAFCAGADPAGGSSAVTTIMVAGPDDVLWEVTVASDDAATHDDLTRQIADTLTFVPR